MQLHEISNKKRKEKRIGRGGKRGTTSGRGQKGQRARAGHSLPRTALGIILKMPKLRGSKNKSKNDKPTIINLSDLERIFDSSHITKSTLLEKKIIKKLSEKIKILGKGEVTKPFIIEGLIVSKNAKEKIEKAGGSVNW